MIDFTHFWLPIKHDERDPSNTKNFLNGKLSSHSPLFLSA